MHKEAFEFVASYATSDSMDVIEIGSRNVNGSVRSLFPNASWFGIDVEDGRDVDLVVDAMEFEPEHQVDMVICCEVLEHAERWQEIILRAGGWLRLGGRLIITVAGPGRKPHSAFDGGDVRAGEYYANVSPEQLSEVTRRAGLVGFTQTFGAAVDVYYWGIKA
jgi:predicted SAM-dependent methyltransferase